MDRGATHELRYGLINRAFNFPEDRLQTITMIQNGRQPCLQIDQYPPEAVHRTVAAGALPMGNAMVSILVQNLEELALGSRAVGPISQPSGTFYRGRRTQVVKGSAGELLELIEIGGSDY